MITTVGRGEYTYEWNSNWAQIPDFVDFKQQDGALNARTHAVTVAKDGRVFIFNQSNYAILIFNPDGSYAGTWDEFPSSHFEGAHGLTRHEEGGREFLWLTDEYSSEVVKTTLDGEIVLSIDRPTGGVYADADAPFLPTWAAQAEDGTIFVSTVTAPATSVVMTRMATILIRSAVIRINHAQVNFLVCIVYGLVGVPKPPVRTIK